MDNRFWPNCKYFGAKMIVNFSHSIFCFFECNGQKSIEFCDLNTMKWTLLPKIEIGVSREFENCLHGLEIFNHKLSKCEIDRPDSSLNL